MAGNRTAKRVVITGASSGIGAATAIAFARQGARLMLAARGQAGLDDIAAKCRAVGGQAHVRVLDVTDAPAVAEFAAEAAETLGGSTSGSAMSAWESSGGMKTYRSRTTRRSSPPICSAI